MNTLTRETASSTSAVVFLVVSPSGGLQSAVPGAAAQVDVVLPSDVPGKVVRQVRRHHGLGVPQLVGQRHEDGLHVVRPLVVFGRRLKQRHVVAVCKLLGQVGVDSHALANITLVANQNPAMRF